MKILIYLYDSDGHGKKVNLDEIVLDKLNDKQLLWVNILEREQQSIEQVTTALQLKNVPFKGILRTAERPKIYKLDDFYHFFIISVESGEKGEICPIPIDFLCGKNFVITVHDGNVDYLQEFGRREKNQTSIGELDTESFVATMLDLHIGSYFRVLEKIEREVDEMDEKILSEDLEDKDFLKRMVGLRKEVSKLRRWFLPHRDVFYALSRPDFKQIAESDSFENFQLLNGHFESAVDSIESSRDTVLSLFDLYTTKTSHRMNSSMRRLTFITLMVGGMSVIAGILGMNFEEDFFKSPKAFWFVVAGMMLLASGTTFFAWKKRWF